ncbi:MAG: ABC transporter substrate-binding protein [Pseudoclavibacter sp.]
MSNFAKSSPSRKLRITTGIAAMSVGVFMLAACSSTTDGGEPSAEGDAAAAVCGPDTAETVTEVSPVEAPTAQERSEALKIGSLLPQTGTLAFLGPPEIAGVDLAVAEINASPSGVLGGNISVVHRDSGDTSTDIATQSVTDLLSQNVSAIIGAASSGVSMTVIDQITGAGVVQISPANTSAEFSTYDDKGFYFRTAPSDILQGRVNGNTIVNDGNASVGIIYLNDAYGSGLSESITTAVEAAGGEVVASEAFNEGDSQFSAQIDAVTAADPDAIALVAFDQTATIVPQLIGTKGFPSDKLYMVDGNMADYSADFEEGTLNCAKGTIPGVVASDDFRAKLLGIDPELKDYTYGAESYDAVILAALAAQAGGAADPATIKDNMQKVSADGEKCTTYADCVALLEAGTDIDYDGVSGPISFDENGDPSEATIGIYQYGNGNTYSNIGEEAGQL